MLRNISQNYGKGFITKGFQMTFENGLTISVMFGTSNYCSRKQFYDNGQRLTDGHEDEEMWSSPDCEIAVWAEDRNDYENSWMTFKNGDKVNGWLGADDVADYICKVKNAKSIDELHEGLSYKQQQAIDDITDKF